MKWRRRKRGQVMAPGASLPPRASVPPSPPPPIRGKWLGDYCVPGCPDDVCRSLGECAWPLTSAPVTYIPAHLPEVMPVPNSVHYAVRMCSACCRQRHDECVVVNCHCPHPVFPPGSQWRRKGSAEEPVCVRSIGYLDGWIVRAHPVVNGSIIAGDPQWFLEHFDRIS